jgi:hypothetical protein
VNKTAATPSVYYHSELNDVTAPTLPTIPIFKDNQTFTAPVLERMHEHNSMAAPNLKLNDQSSIFIYGGGNESSQEPPAVLQPAPAVKRKPLGLLVDNEPVATGDSVDSYSTTTTDSPSLTTKILEFEPPAASTRNIRPLLNKMGIANKLGAVSNEDEECTMNDSELNSFLCTGNGGDQDEKKRLSNILAQDFPTAVAPKFNAPTTETKTPTVVSDRQPADMLLLKSATQEDRHQHTIISTTTKQVKLSCDMSNMTSASVMARASGSNFSNTYEYDEEDFHMQIDGNEIVTHKQSNHSSVKVSLGFVLIFYFFIKVSKFVFLILIFL